MLSDTETTVSILADGQSVSPREVRGKTSGHQGSTNPIATTNSSSDTCRQWLYARFSLLRSTAFRMGILFWLMFTTCFGIAEYAFYQMLQDQLLNRIDTSITHRFTQVQQVYNADGVEAVIALGEARSEAPMTSSMGFHLSSIDGDRIAGNVPICLTEPGWDVLVGNDIGLAEDDSVYRFYTHYVGDYVLSLGKNMDDLVELRQMAFQWLIWTTLASTLLAFFAAWFFARRTHNRVVGISSVLDVVATGDLNARLPLSYVGDDIDQLSAKINTSLDRLSQSVDGMRQVSTDIAHDLKTPLNRLFIKIEEAANKSRAGFCVGHDLDGALSEAQAINGTFEALLRIAQIEAGARRSQFKRVDLSHVLETAAEVYGPVVEEHGHNLIVDLQPQLSLPMLGDRSLLLQLIVNLVENAVHHCPPGTNIALSGGDNDDMIWFRVADSGVGIPESERLNVFQRLYRLERSRTTSGTGLGLSLVKAITDLHYGTVSLGDNKPGLVVSVCFKRSYPNKM